MERPLKVRLTVVLTLIVVLPLVGLGWLGTRVARNERVVVEQRFNALVLDRLRDVDAGIAAYLAQRERDLFSLPALSGQTVDQLRAMARESATVRQFFVLNDRNELRYPVSLELVREYASLRNGPDPVPAPFLQQPPSPDGAEARELSITPLTAEETAFLERTHAIWAGKRIPTNDSGESRHVNISTQFKGWYAWYWGDGLNLIFWWRDWRGAVVGAELNPVRLAADIIGALPDSNPESATLADGRISLIDSKGATIYQWGALEPAKRARPAASLPLRAPLSAWHLQYHAAPNPAGTALGGGVVFNIVSGIVVLGLALMALAVYYHRESSREMREAAQRVSFVNQVSHELKTPLTSIRMYAEMLDGELDGNDEKARRHVGVIVAESQRLSRLIGNVLTFSRKQRSALKLHRAPGSVDGVIRSVLGHFEPALAAKGLAVAFDAGAARVALFDQDSLEQILGNLLGNVEKYAASGDRVEIHSRQGDGMVSITVADNGPGIPPRERNRVFMPFYRISNRLTDGVTGAGIGLAIARDLARLHGGDLTLEPAEKGACFRVVIHAPAADANGERT